MKPRNLVLEGFTTHKISVKGTVRVNITLGTDSYTQDEELKFYVVDIDSLYNAILGTLTHAAFELVISIPHQQVRFSTKNGVRFEKSNPKSLFGYMMKSRRYTDEGHKASEIGSILMTEENQILE